MTIWYQIFELSRGINGTNVLTKFHEDRTINVASRVFTRQNVDDGRRTTDKRRSQKKKKHYTSKSSEKAINVTFQVLTRITSLAPDIITTNVHTKFHDDWTKNCHLKSLSLKNARPPNQTINVLTRVLQIKDIYSHGDHVFQFHEDCTINVTFRVKKSPPHGHHVFQPTKTIFKLVQDIIGTNLFNKRIPVGILVQDIIRTNLLTKVLTRENAPLPGGHAFNQPETFSNSLLKDIIGTNLLTKFHEDRK
ncbi:hypothetical protein DPMN_001208 [Dreissena polymorpha]|uniref:Uncharacterized protein n=1 Tax=Dreissena polymorpha TaxID=45954 RepID=A0A9D4MJM7_DREPO|nr:hypothetical protein DPMN_001208 [Dreissena polymorpha]